MTFSPGRFHHAGAYGWTADRASYEGPPITGRTDVGNYAYERFRADDKFGNNFSSSNPEFSSDAAGRLISTVHYNEANAIPGGTTARILRGFIRRADYDAADPISTSRLYFMYNPTIIARDYVSYLDQGALDPFNTVFQSDNLVAPPSMLNFTFELFFDRQDEARVASNPGVLVDMEYFDMVVRNVIPDPAHQSMPDNGVMMVNPRDITVVFSPEITVQGRPLNASVVYEKFTHRMIPTRMRIQLTMRVIYWGPQREMNTYVEEAVSASRVNYAATTAATYAFTWADMVGTATGASVQAIIDYQLGFITVANAAFNSTTGGGGSGPLAYAIQQWNTHSTKYSLAKRMDLWEYADCSSLVWGGFQGVGQAATMGWSTTQAPSTWSMCEGFKTSTAVQKLWGFDGNTDKVAGAKAMQVGDLLLRVGGGAGDDHISFVSKNDATSIQVFHAMSPDLDVGYSTYNHPVTFDYDHGVRPLVLGANSTTNQTNDRSNL